MCKNMKEKFCQKYERKIFHFGNSFFAIKKSKNLYKVEVPEKVLNWNSNLLKNCRCFSRKCIFYLALYK